MIIDLEKFVAAERGYWRELESQLDQLERGSKGADTLSLPQIERFHYLYQRAASDLARLATFSAEGELRRALGALVGRAYAEIHATTRWSAPADRLWLWRWLMETFPQTFRRHLAAFWLVTALTLLGAGFGALALRIDPEAKEVIMPFPHLQGSPADRVAEEEKETSRIRGHEQSFAGQLMTHNIRVSIAVAALGFTWALGTILLIFYNGIILGAVVFDYLRAGQGVFVCAWLLPHGSFEIPAILVAGQAGLLIGHALIGRGRGRPLRERLRAIRGDVTTLLCGVALMLVWAGIVEGGFSQYHAPVLPYWLKISFGVVELTALTLFLTLAGRKPGTAA